MCQVQHLWWIFWPLDNRYASSASVFYFHCDSVFEFSSHILYLFVLISKFNVILLVPISSHSERLLSVLCCLFLQFVVRFSHNKKMSMKIAMVVCWVVAPCGLTGGYQRFGGTYRLHLQGRSEDVPRNFANHLQVHTGWESRKPPTKPKN
jgi:hypothetical protein